MRVMYHILGQVSGGKNNINITKKGKRYPNKRYQAWLQSAYSQIQQQQSAHPQHTTTARTTIIVDYFPSDRRVRDATAILDAVFHVMEKMAVVKNDRQFKTVMYAEHEVDAANPRVDIEIHYCQPKEQP